MDKKSFDYIILYVKLSNTEVKVMYSDEKINQPTNEIDIMIEELVVSKEMKVST